MSTTATATAANDVEIVVAVNRKRGLVRLMLRDCMVEEDTWADMPPAQAREVAASLMDAAARADGMDISGAKLNGVSKKPITRPDDADAKIAWENFQYDLGGDMSGTPPEEDP